MGDDEVVNIWSNKQVILKEYVNYDTSPTESNMCIRTSSFKSDIVGGSMAILLKNLYLSCDPSMRIRMMKLQGSFPHSFKPGSRLSSFGVGKVIGSGHPKFKEGDLVWGRTGWEEYTLIDDHSQLQDMFIIDQHCHDIPLSYYTGILGISGITAYAGFYEVCKPKKGESVFVSAASGAVGQLVGQFAKLLGCYVVGSAGSSQKVDLLKSELGYDEAFNYKEEQCLYAALKRYFPKGIDIYFDNVGGKMLDAVIANMRPHGRIAICGMISQYKSESESESQSEGIRNLACLILNRIRMEGFVATEYYHLYPKFHQFVVELIRDKKIVYMEDVAQGLENGPSAFLRLFSGLNIGKQLIQVASHHQ